MTPHPPALLARVLLAVEEFCRAHHRLVLLLGVLTFAGGAWISSTLRYETDILDLLPQSNPEVQAFRETARIFGALDTFPVMLEAAEGYFAEDYEEFADRLSERLRQDPEISVVDARIDPDSELVRYFQSRLPLFLDPDDIGELRQKLANGEIDAQVAEDRKDVESLLPQAKDLVVRDPLRLSPLLLRRFAAARGSSSVRWSEGHLTSKDGDALLLLIRPARPAQDVASAAVLVGRVNDAIDATVAEMAGLDEELPPPRRHLGGRYAISVADSQLILHDIRYTIVLSFLGVVGLYLFCYRRFGAILYSALPLMMGQCLTFALARVAFGALNSSTATSAALLMGLGTDFTIVMYARYVEERRAGASLPEATRKMMGEAALGVYTGAITSAGTFGALMATSFVGMRQFGFLVGSGILLCLVAIVLLLPALVTLVEGRNRSRPPVLYVHSFGFERLIPLARRHPKAVLAACLLVSAAALPLALSLRYSESVEELRSSDNAGLLAQQEIARRFGREENPLMVLTRGADAAETEARARRVEAELRLLRAEGSIHRADGLGSLVPPPEEQEEVLAALRAEGPDFDPGRVEARLRAALRARGFREENFEEAIAVLRASLRPEGIVTAEEVSRHGGADLVRRFFRRDGEGWAAVSYVYGDLGPEDVARLRKADPEVAVTGVSILSASLKKTLRRDVILCLSLGLVLVAILLAIDFRSWADAGLALAQLLFGLLWMFGAMKLFGVSLTMVNAFAAALLLGVGIDYGIHILHRLRGPDRGDEGAVLETGKAVAMAAMTNVVGFGVLFISKYPGLQGLGQAAVLGSIGCMLTALTLLPALEALTARRAPAAG